MSIRILHVDDSEHGRTLVRDALLVESSGIQLTEAKSREEFETRLAEGNYDLVLTDFDILGFDGLQVLGAVQTSCPGVPVVVVTGTGSELIAVEAMKRGAADYVIKTPSQIHDLPQTVEIVLRKQRAWHRQLQAEEELRRSEAEARRQSRELGLLNRVIAASTASQDVQAILKSVCRELTQAGDVPQAIAALLNPEKTEARIVAGYNGEGQIQTVDRIVLEEDCQTCRNLLSGEISVITEDGTTGPFGPALRDDTDFQDNGSLLLVPLMVDEEVAGALFLEIDEASGFCAEDTALAQLAAERISGAMARVRLEERHRALDERLHESQKMDVVGRLAGGVSQNLSNLLTAIIGYTDLLLGNIDQEDPRRSDVWDIRHAADQAAFVIRQLLAFSRRQMLQPKLLDLNELIGSAEGTLRRSVGEDIELTIRLMPGLALVEVDPAQTRQVILDLIVNARQAMAHGGDVIVETEKVELDDSCPCPCGQVERGTYVMLAVSDTGIGIGVEDLPHVFEPFYTTTERGTGLGLATVYGIVKQSNGHITIETEPDRGTRVSVYFPAAVSPDAVVAQVLQTDCEGPRGSETILLVDDEEVVRRLTERALRTNGYAVLAAENGDEALRLSENYEGPIHLLISDVVMPGGMNGFEVADRLTHVRPDTRVLFVSGYSDEVIDQHSGRQSGIVLLQKPYDPCTILNKVREMLDDTHGRKS